MIKRFPVMDDFTKMLYLDPLNVLYLEYYSEKRVMELHLSSGKEILFHDCTLNDFEGYVNLVATAQRKAEQEWRK